MYVNSKVVNREGLRVTSELLVTFPQGGWDKVSKSRDRRAHFTPSLVKECDFSDQQRSDLAQ